MRYCEGRPEREWLDAVAERCDRSDADDSGRGACQAFADGSFMDWKNHHPGESGGFVLEANRADYIAGEVLGLRLHHPGGELLIGFLIYAQDASDNRYGLFTPVSGSTLSGGLSMDCANIGHTITHDVTGSLPRVRLHVSLPWTAPAPGADALTFRALVLRADPMADNGTDFYEVSLELPMSVDGVFRDRFESAVQ